MAEEPRSPGLPGVAPEVVDRGWVLYVDLDAFYVSCELRERPELVGRPVIVGPPASGGPTRGVVLSASYEARAFGVHSAQPASQAARLCPTATWIPPDFSKYVRISREVRHILERFSPDVQPMSIDEAALRLPPDSPEHVASLGREVQDALRAEAGLPASIGLASTRAVAKIATDQAKPAGIRVVPRGTEAAFLAPLPVRAIPGVGPKTEELLHAAGVTTIGELAARRPAELARSLGGFARYLVRLARGEGVDPVEEPGGPRSRSTDHTFPEDVAVWEDVEGAVRDMSADLAKGLETEGLRYSGVAVSFRWADFTRSQRSRALSAAQEGAPALGVVTARLARELWDAEQAGQARPVRTVSVRAERLSERRQRQASLDRFDGDPGDPRTPFGGSAQ